MVSPPSGCALLKDVRCPRTSSPKFYAWAEHSSRGVSQRTVICEKSRVKSLWRRRRGLQLRLPVRVERVEPQQEEIEVVAVDVGVEIEVAVEPDLRAAAVESDPELIEVVG